ncbi:MAG: HlyD family type I secretion periplasmic adaptor subunit [Desulfobacteraceae bacterium]|nr:HlyD family type I secretion periplasmic adaptor subunit [Desulfobacteraceae bacterium]
MNFSPFKKLPGSDPNPLDFAPPLLRLQDTAPNPLGRRIIWSLLFFLCCLLLWTLFGKLDIVAVAEGKLVPQSYVKIIQPAESGIVKEILVAEGESVKAGQVLMRMDMLISQADAKALKDEYDRKRLTLRRIDAELSGKPFQIEGIEPQALAAEVKAQYRADRASLEAALAEERSRLNKVREDLSAAEEISAKLTETLPHYLEQEKAFAALAEKGTVAGLTASDKRRERIEKEHELNTQKYVVKSARAGVRQSEKTLVQIESDYRRRLHTERNEVANAMDRLRQEIAKQDHRMGLLELKASQDGIVKDLATHTSGTVVQPGTVMLTLVPVNETLRAEVWISNADIGFVRVGQTVKLKFAAFPFQKYGMALGVVEHLSADASGSDSQNGNPFSREAGQAPLGYKALIALESMTLEVDGNQFQLTAGMQTNAEIHLGTRTVAAYLLSPIRKAWHEAGRER